MSLQQMDGQDWETVVVRGKTKKTASETDKKPVHPAVAAIRRIEAAEGPVKVKRISNESKQLIINTRVAAGQTQTQLNTVCAFPQYTIRDIESGKFQPSPGHLNVLNRVLKLSLKFE